MRHDGHAQFAIGPSIKNVLQEFDTRASAFSQLASDRVLDFVKLLDEQRAGGAPITATYREVYDAQIEHLVEEARKHDLVVIGRARQKQGLAQRRFERLICECERPLLIPAKETPNSLTGAIMVYWNGSDNVCKTSAGLRTTAGARTTARLRKDRWAGRCSCARTRSAFEPVCKAGCIRRTAELAERWSCTGSARARGQRTRCDLGCDGRLRSMAATPTRSRQLYRRFAPLHRAAHPVDALRPWGIVAETSSEKCFWMKGPNPCSGDVGDRGAGIGTGRTRFRTLR
jgi:hypothetical protein